MRGPYRSVARVSWGGSCKLSLGPNTCRGVILEKNDIHFDAFCSSFTHHPREIWKSYIHFGAFGSIFTHHPRKIWYPFWWILRYFYKSPPKMFWKIDVFWSILKYFAGHPRKIFEKLISIFMHFEVFSQVTPGQFHKTFAGYTDQHKFATTSVIIVM